MASTRQARQFILPTAEFASGMTAGTANLTLLLEVDMCCLELRCTGVVLASVLVAALAGCSQQSGQQPGDAAVDAQLPMLPSSSETSLSLKRGLILVSGQTATFQPCGSDTVLWIIDQSDGSYQAVVGIAQPNEPLYAEARGERSPAPSGEPAASGYTGAFVLEQILYAGEPAAGVGCDGPAPAYIVRARGSEPPIWTVEVTEPKMEWMQDQGEAITVESPQEADTEGAVSYEGRNAQHALQLIIDAQVCRDPTTEEFFAYSARAVLDGKEFRGCARVGR
jgi:uncharacterized membrane protein